MKTKKDIQELTAAEAGEVVNDLMEGQYDVDDANREQEKIAAEVLDHKDEDQVEAVIRHMAADQCPFSPVIPVAPSGKVKFPVTAFPSSPK